VHALNAYILRQLVTSFGFFFVSLTGVLWLSQSLRSVDLIVNKGLSAGWFFYLTALLLPFLLTLVIPIAQFAAVLYTYHRLSTEAELMVMWAAGVSTRALARPALLLAGAMTVVAYALTLYFMPAGQREFRDMKTSIRSSMAHVLLQEGTFNTIGSHLTVYIRARRGGGELLGLLVHDSRNPDKPVTMMAESGALIRTEGGPRFLLVNGNRQEMERRTGKLSTLYFDRYALDLAQFAPREGGLWLEPRERYLHELIWLSDSTDDQANKSDMYAEAHDRIVSPLYVPVFTLIALATLLAGEFSRRGYMWRITAALAAAVLVRLAGLGFVNLAAKVPALTPLMYLNVIVPAALCLLLLAGRLRFVGRRLGMPIGAG
jgi:lipopolysaccharide export system permease protein